MTTPEVDQSAYQEWIETIANYDTTFKTWEGRSEKIIKRYRDENRSKTGNGTAKFNILWANVQTIVPATFSRLPKPDVSRRFRDNDPVGRVASLILERALEFEIEHYPDYRAAMRNSVFDRFLGGRGISWVRYEPHFKASEQGMPEDGVQVTEDADEAEDETPEADEAIDYECAPVDYVNWKDFGHSVARTWEEVTSVWRKVYMGRDALVERFGEELGNKIPLDTRPEEQKKNIGSEGDYQALILEIWDKESNKALWISKSLGKILDERDDPLELEGFFPCPRPLFATLTSDSLVPVPDFTLYQDQANELDTLTDRIDGLIKALQVKGVYDASVPELARLFTEGASGDMIPVKNWQAFAEKKGLGGAIDLVDIAPIAAALVIAYKAMEQVKGQIHEITGLSDILRGDTEAQETATAQRLKGSFGSLRLKTMQGEVVQFATELLQIKAQIMCKFFQPETLVKISACQQLSQDDQRMIPQALQLLKQEPLRNFRIEVSTDSMVQLDEMQEKADRMEFLKATGEFLEKAFPIIQSEPAAGPLLVEMLKFGVTAFKVGKAIEGKFDNALDQLQQQAAQPQQKKPDPEMAKIQAKAQADGQQAQMTFQLDQQRNQMEMQVETHRQQMQAAQIQQQNQIEAQRSQQDAQNEAKLEQMRLMHDASQAQITGQLEILIARMNNAAKVDVAELGAATTIQAAQISAANSASNDNASV